MKLGAWLDWKGITAEAFAARIGCDTSTITRLIPRDGKKQVRMPSMGLANRIAEATEHQVTANDFAEPDPEDDPETGIRPGDVKGGNRQPATGLRASGTTGSR